MQWQKPVSAARV